MKNATVAFDMGLHVNHPYPKYTFTYLGKETISTKWGPRSCVHYSGTYPYVKDSPIIHEFWLLKGVLIKHEEHWPDFSGNPDAQIYRTEIKDTNLGEVINP